MDLFNENKQLEKERTWQEEWNSMPEYNNPKPVEPEVLATFKFKTKEDFETFMEVVKRELYNDKRVFDGKQKKNDYNAWFPLPDRPSENVYVSIVPKCKYCEQFAEMKSYRDNNGCVSSELVCYDCNDKTNKELNK